MKTLLLGGGESGHSRFEKTRTGYHSFRKRYNLYVVTLF